MESEDKSDGEFSVSVAVDSDSVAKAQSEQITTSEMETCEIKTSLLKEIHRRLLGGDLKLQGILVNYLIQNLKLSPAKTLFEQLDQLDSHQFEEVEIYLNKLKKISRNTPLPELVPSYSFHPKYSPTAMQLVRRTFYGEIIQVDIYSSDHKKAIEFVVEKVGDDEKLTKELRDKILKDMGLAPVTSQALGDDTFRSRHLDEAILVWEYLSSHYHMTEDVITQVNSKLLLSYGTSSVSLQTLQTLNPLEINK